MNKESLPVGGSIQVLIEAREKDLCSTILTVEDEGRSKVHGVECLKIVLEDQCCRLLHQAVGDVNPLKIRPDSQELAPYKLYI